MVNNEFSFRFRTFSGYGLSFFLLFCVIRGVYAQEQTEIDNKIREEVGIEEIARQEGFVQAEKKFTEANKIFFEAEAENYIFAKAYKNFEDSIKLYIEAKQGFENCGNSNFVKQKVNLCSQMIEDAYRQWALKLTSEGDQLIDKNDFDEGLQKYQSAVKLVPNSPAFIKRLEKLTQSAIYRKEVSEKSVVPEKSIQEYSTDVLFAQGVKLYEAGMYDKARDKFEEILALDPYHYDSIEYVRRIYRRMIDIGKVRYEATRLERMAEAEWKVVTPLIPRTMTGESMTANEPIAKPEVESKINEKLKNIIIDHIEFEEQTIPTVVKYLKQRSKQLDPEKVGVNIFLRLNTGAEAGATEETDTGDETATEETVTATDGEATDTETAAEETTTDEGAGSGGGAVPTVTMVVDDIPLGQALLYICRAANLKYRIEKYAIVIADPSIPLDDVETRIYPIEQEVVSEIGGDVDEDAVTQFFERRGVNFPVGAKVVYDTRISRLIATNTPENLIKIEEIIRELNVIDPQVLIQAKFVEISQNDLAELAFQYTLSRTPAELATARNPKPIGDQGSSVTFGPNDQILRNVEDGAFGTVSRPDEVFNLSTISKDGYHFNWVVHALDQADSSDTLSTPRVTTLNGQPATIRMVTEVYYPEEWSEADVGNLSGPSGGVPIPYIVGSIPTFGEVTEIGIILNVTPNVDADNYTISLDMNPVVQEFAGWTDYSYQVDFDGVPVTNILKMPQIAARTVETTVTIYDGETLILGGIIRDQTSEILDKVPIIGDIPIVGRLFQSRAQWVQKRNLLIFLTCRLVHPDGSPIRERELRGLPPFRQ